MKLLFVDTAQAVFGGLERITAEKMNLFSSEYGYDVHYVTINQGSHPMPYPLNYSISHYDLDINFHHLYDNSGFIRFMRMIRKELVFIIRLRRLIKHIQPDIIVLPRLELWEVFLCSNEIPVVFESHNMCKGSSFESKTFANRQREIFLKWMIRRAKVVVTLTEGDAIDWSKYNSHICVIPNIVHLNQSGRISNQDSRSVIFVGRYCYQKDLPSLLQIWKYVNKRHPDWELHIYGHSDDGGDYLRNIGTIIPRVTIHPPTPSIIDKFLQSSMLLMTSVYEPFGLVLPEAMSCGLPVVAFDCPYGPGEIITDSNDGFLISNRNVHTYAERVCQLIESKELRQKMGKSAVLSSMRYSSQRILPQWEALFNKLYNGQV